MGCFPRAIYEAPKKERNTSVKQSGRFCGAAVSVHDVTDIGRGRTKITMPQYRRTDMDYIHSLCKRVLELDELYMKFQILTGYTAEQLLELFAKGYELTQPDPPMSLSEFAFQEDLKVKEGIENMDNAHIKIQYNYEELSVSEICKRLKNAEARAEKAEKERDAAVSDLETVMAYGGGNLDTCQFCKNGQCYARGGTKLCFPEWRGQKEE